MAGKRARLLLSSRNLVLTNQLIIRLLFVRMHTFMIAVYGQRGKIFRNVITVLAVVHLERNIRIYCTKTVSCGLALHLLRSPMATKCPSAPDILWSLGSSLYLKDAANGCTRHGRSEHALI
jgi:hypothetical protein